MKPVAKFLTIVVVFLSIQTATQASPEQLYFGSVAMDIPAVMHRRLTPLTKYLSAAINKPVNLKLSPDMRAAISEVASGSVDIAYLTPVAYLKAQAKGDSKILVKTVTNHKASFQLMLVVAENSPIKTVEDLVGKSFAFGDKAALLQRAVVVGAGLPLAKLGSYKFIGHYDNIVRGVLNGDFDAGILKDTKAYAWQKKGIRIIYSSPHLPPYNITINKSMHKDLEEKLRNAFLALDSRNPQHKKIIHSLSKKYTGFATTSDQEYDVIRQLIKPFNQ